MLTTYPYSVKHQIIKIDGLGQLLNSTLVEGGAEVPEGHYAEENMKDTVVPNRNKIFSSIIQAVAFIVDYHRAWNNSWPVVLQNLRDLADSDYERYGEAMDTDRSATTRARRAACIR